MTRCRPHEICGSSGVNGMQLGLDALQGRLRKKESEKAIYSRVDIFLPFLFSLPTLRLLAELANMNLGQLICHDIYNTKCHRQVIDLH